MSGVEIQANFMASLMTDSFLQIPPQWLIVESTIYRRKKGGYRSKMMNA